MFSGSAKEVLQMKTDFNISKNFQEDNCRELREVPGQPVILTAKGSDSNAYLRIFENLKTTSLYSPGCFTVTRISTHLSFLWSSICRRP